MSPDDRVKALANESNAHANRCAHRRPHMITWNDLIAGTLLFTIPQIPLTIGNAVIAGTAENNELFPDRKVTEKRISISQGIMNLLLPFFGGIPVCHGAGGMAGHVRFGARTGGALFILGAILIIIALFFSSSVAIIFKIFPNAILSVILFFAGSELAIVVKDIGEKKADFYVMLIAASFAMRNTGVAFGHGQHCWSIQSSSSSSSNLTHAFARCRWMSSTTCRRLSSVMLISRPLLPNDEGMMVSIAPLVYGFLAALIFMVIAVSALYLYLRRSREKQANIKGYLDLIPDLTESQRAKLQEIRHVFLPRVERIRRDMRLKRPELAELLFSERPDRTRNYQVAETIIGSQPKVEQEVIEHILEEKELLTLSQKQKFYEIIVEQFSGGGIGVHDVRTQSGRANPG